MGLAVAALPTKSATKTRRRLAHETPLLPPDTDWKLSSDILPKSKITQLPKKWKCVTASLTFKSYLQNKLLFFMLNKKV